MPRPEHRRFLATILIAVYLHLAWPQTKQDIAANNIANQMELQARLLELIPETDCVVSVSFTAPTFRHDPSYIYCSDIRAQKDVLPPAKQKYFTEAYFYERLCATRPSYFCFYTMQDQPPEYISACEKYLSTYAGSYSGMNMRLGGQIINASVRNDVTANKK